MKSIAAERWGSGRRAAACGLVTAGVVCAALAIAPPTATAGQARGARTFATPEEAVTALAQAVRKGAADEVLAVFGPEGRQLIDPDQAAARRNRQVFAAAFRESWRLVDEGEGRKVLVVGNEAWPFPVPIVKDGAGWRFDAAAGKEELIARRIGRNELAVIEIARTYVAAQRHYAQSGHDGKPAGLYARAFASDPGKQNGLYWPDARGQERSPLGNLVAQAASEGRTTGSSSGSKRVPFHGYYFRILTAQGPAAPGGAKSYLVNDEMSGGFGLVAWPAQYDVTGVMTFIVNQDGTLHERDLGTATDAAARKMASYDPVAAWTRVPQQ